MKKSEEEQPDIEIEITNGKTVRVNFSPIEWTIIMTGVSVIAIITGVTL